MTDTPPSTRAASQTRLRYFVAVSPGLEPWLAQELTELGVQPMMLAGGVEVNGTFVDLMRTCVQSRLAESIRVRLKRFDATHFTALEDGLRRLPWHAYLQPTQPLHISVTCHKSRLYHSNAVLERCHRVLEAALRTPLELTARADAPQTVFLRLDHDRVDTSIDASGPHLHRRGYRSHIGHAPLRETLAAALIRIAAAPNATSLWDPFCGSGTIGLEWLDSTLHLSADTRTFAFQQWPTFAAHHAAFDALRTAPGDRDNIAARHAHGSDLDARSLDAAGFNAAQLGATTNTIWHPGDFSVAAAHIPTGSVIVTNPPYGKRVGDQRGLLATLRRFEQLLQHRTDLRPVVMACGFAPFLGATLLPWQRVATTKNGGLPITILRLG